MNISSGKMTKQGTRTIFYGVAGVGKTTLASLLTKPLFIDLEKSTKELDVMRVLPTSWVEFKQTLREFIEDQHGFKTLVIDTGDKLETLLIEHLLNQAGVSRIGDIEGFGGAFKTIRKDIASVLDRELNTICELGVDVVLVYHSMIETQKKPDLTEFNIYNLMYDTKNLGLIPLAWADLILFLNFEVDLVNKGSEKNPKLKVTDQQRVIHTQKGTTFEAKNRFNLPKKLPMINNGKLNPELLQCFAASRDENKSTPSTKPAQEKSKPIETKVSTSADFSTNLDLAEEWEKVKLKAGYWDDVAKLCVEANISTDDIKWVSSEGGKQCYYPKEVPLESYKEEYVKGMILTYWETIKATILKHKGS